jgi:hypothetical protein
MNGVRAQEQMNTAEENDFLKSLGDKLALKLGHAIWAFARIEWLTYRYVKSLSKGNLNSLVDDFLSLTEGQGFSARTKILKKLVRRSGADSALVDNAIQLLNKAMKLAENRNIIVHNPWQIWIDLNKEEFVSEIVHPIDPAMERLSEVDIDRFASDAGAMEHQLEAALRALTHASRTTRSKQRAPEA